MVMKEPLSFSMKSSDAIRQVLVVLRGGCEKVGCEGVGVRGGCDRWV